MRFVVFALAAALPLAHALAQSYPAKPIRILTSAVAGPYDLVLRGFSPALQQSLGQPVIIDNRTGANYVPLGDACAKANPDGYTLCTADLYATVLNVHAYSKLPYGPKDFAPVIHFGYLYSALIVNPSVPANTLQELFALARAKPGSINFGTPGPATNSSMYVDYWNRKGIASFQNISYKSFVQALQAVVSGEVQATIFGVGQAMAQVRAGKAKALAIIGETRTNMAPGVPTMSEAGEPLVIENFGGVIAPAGTARDVILRINSEFKKLIADPVLKEKFLLAQGFEQAPPSGGSPEEFAAFLEAEHRKIDGIVKVTGLRLD